MAEQKDSAIVTSLKKAADDVLEMAKNAVGYAVYKAQSGLNDAAGFPEDNFFQYIDECSGAKPSLPKAACKALADHVFR